MSIVHIHGNLLSGSPSRMSSLVISGLLGPLRVSPNDDKWHEYANRGLHQLDLSRVLLDLLTKHLCERSFRNDARVEVCARWQLLERFRYDGIRMVEPAMASPDSFH